MELLMLGLYFAVIALIASVEIPDQRRRIRVLDRDTEQLLALRNAQRRWMD